MFNAFIQNVGPRRINLQYIVQAGNMVSRIMVIKYAYKKTFYPPPLHSKKVIILLCIIISIVCQWVCRSQTNSATHNWRMLYPIDFKLGTLIGIKVYMIPIA